MSLKLAYNTTDATILVDDSGFTIGGRLWGPIDTTDKLAKAELDSDRLLLVDEDGAAGSEHPDVVLALAALKARRERRDRAAAMDKDQLAAVLPAEVVDGLEVGGDGKPSKDDLVEAAEDVEAVLPPEPEPEPEPDPAPDTTASSKKSTTTSRRGA